MRWLIVLLFDLFVAVEMLGTDVLGVLLFLLDEGDGGGVVGFGEVGGAEVGVGECGCSAVCFWFGFLFFFEVEFEIGRDLVFFVLEIKHLLLLFLYKSLLINSYYWII